MLIFDEAGVARMPPPARAALISDQSRAARQKQAPNCSGQLRLGRPVDSG
ncbi:MAG TPA: hypothetical protein VGC64_06835 [Pyrinomonadaceae bacterium]